jgi:hypothetical protein
MLSPIIEAWDVEVKFLMIIGLLSPEPCPMIYMTKINDKIFNKYGVEFKYNKLLSKMFYDGEIKI